MPDPPLAPEGARLHIDRRVLTCFYPPGHPDATSRHGPLVKGWATFTYLGPDPARDAVHLAGLPYDPVVGTSWVVYFHPDEARWIDDPAAPSRAPDGPDPGGR